MITSLRIPIAIVTIQFLLQWQKLETNNILYLAIITSIVIISKLKIGNIHFLIRHSFLASFIAIQFIFEEYTITKDFFINCLYILLLFKFLETKNKNYFFFISLCIFLTVSSLINNQNLISSILSGTNLILIIILLYLINQRELININFGNLKRLFLIILIAVPTIIITYLIFPRTDVNISFFNNKKNNLGIPDTISLGTFEKITQSDRNIFDVTFNQKVDQNQLYFRVKTFSIIDLKKNWIPLETKVNFKNNYKTSFKETDLLEYSVIIDAHDKKWVPVLDYVLPTNNLNYDYHNFTYKNDKKIINKRRFNFISQVSSPFKKTDKKNLKYFLQLPNTISKNLIKWANVNKRGKSDLAYLNFIMEHFKKNEYFYNLSPQPIGNNYGKFFFQNKDGYCEYYAGTMTILSRAAGIPARIVTGYYGGVYNDYGNFFTFSQLDSHSWIEAWIKNKGWVRFDPTQMIPVNRIKSNLNSFTSNNQENENENENFYEFISTQSLNLWFQYLDYQWSNFLLSYDSQKRRELIGNFFKSDKDTIIFILLNITLVLTVIFLFIFIIILFNKKNYSTFLFLLLVKKLKIKNYTHETHQDIFFRYFKINAISSDKILFYQKIINNYEKGLFSNQSISFFKFANNSFQILFKN